MNTFPERCFAWCRKTVNSKWFNILVTAVILFSTVLVGISIDPSISDSWKNEISTLETIILAFFCVEIFIRIAAEGNKPLNYFRDWWNVFDFAIVALCFLPFMTKFLMILRLARVFRTLRLFRALPKLRIIISGMVKSLSSVIYVAILLLMLVYVYVVIGGAMFSEADATNFGNVPTAFFTMFQILTLESWNVIMVPVVQAFPIGGPVFFVSFIILGTMLFMNLFLGVIVTNMSKAMKEIDEEQERSNEEKILDKVSEMEQQLETLNKKILKK